MAMKYSEESHFSHIILWSVDGSAAARHLYQKEGFYKTGERIRMNLSVDEIIEEKWETNI